MRPGRTVASVWGLLQRQRNKLGIEHRSENAGAIPIMHRRAIGERGKINFREGLRYRRMIRDGRQGFGETSKHSPHLALASPTAATSGYRLVR